VKRSIFVIIICILSCAGCATTIDLQETQQKFNSDIRVLKDESTDLRKDLEQNNEAISEIRKRVADISADITGIREDMETLKGDREVMGRSDSELKAELLRKENELADVKTRFDHLSSRVAALENLFEIGKTGAQAPGAEKGTSSQSTSATAGKTDEEQAYESAYAAFKEEKFDKARENFQDFLKRYPNSGNADSAQFWIGESYYFERKFEQAILEYEKVIKNYPKGSKVPYALLKQGFSFLNIGDKPSAKLLFEQVVKDYPATSQARMARAKLEEIK